MCLSIHVDNKLRKCVVHAPIFLEATHKPMVFQNKYCCMCWETRDISLQCTKLSMWRYLFFWISLLLNIDMGLHACCNIPCKMRVAIECKTDTWLLIRRNTSFRLKTTWNILYFFSLRRKNVYKFHFTTYWKDSMHRIFVQQNIYVLVNFLDIEWNILSVCLPQRPHFSISWNLFVCFVTVLKLSKTFRKINTKCIDSIKRPF